MIQPSESRFDDDPEELELPPLAERSNDDEGWQPDDDSDLDLDPDDTDRGLDTDLGVPEDDGDTAEDEPAEESWLEPGELRAGLVGDDDPVDDDGEERNWSEGSEPPPANAEDFIDDIGIDEAAATDEDSGQEGFGDDNALPDLDLERLPPLDDTLAADAEDTDIESFSAEWMNELRSGSEEVRVEILFEGGPEVQLLAADGGTGVGWNGALLVAMPGQAATSRYSDAEGVLALAARDCPTHGLHIALCTAGAVLCSRDGGHHFSIARGLTATGVGVAPHLAWSGGESGPRLWVADADAGVWVSDDLGGEFRPAFAAMPGASVLRSEDGLALGTAPASRRTEPYGFSRSDSGWVLVRYDAASGEEPLCALPASAGAPRQLAISPRAGRTTLHVVCERAWLRVVLAAVAARRAP